MIVLIIIIIIFKKLKFLDNFTTDSIISDAYTVTFLKL